MSEPVNERARLLDGHATELESMLLRAGRGDAPPDPALRAERIATIKVAARGAAAVGGGLLALRIVGMLRAGAWKWVAIGLGVTVAGASVAQLAEHAPPDALPAPVVATAPRERPKTAEPRPAMVAPTAEPAHVVASPSAPAPPLARTPRREPLGRGSPPSRPRGESADTGAELASRSAAAASADARGAPPIETTRAASMRDEIAALQGIRRSIEASQPDRALAALDDFQSSHPSSVLAEEASVLRIEALLLAGRTAEARRLVERFREQWPKSSYTPRIRARFDDRE